MAISGTITGTKTSDIWLTFEWTRSNIDVSANTSTITWTLKLNRTNSLNFSADKSYSLTVDGERFNGNFSDNIDWGTGSHSAIIKEGISTLNHDASGKKTFSVNAIFNIAVTISGTYVASVSLSGTQSLDDIPRASSITTSPASGVKIGDTITINVNRALSTFKHTLTWKFGESVGTIAENVETSTTWAIPRALANQIPNSLSGICVLTCKTYDDSKLIGSKSINLSLKVSDSDIPSITGFTIDEGVSAIKSKFNAFVQNQSKAKINITASGIYSSTIKTYQIKINEETYYNNNLIVDLQTSGQINVIVTVTDSRGRSTSQTKTINVLAYQSPTITQFKCQRANQSGSEDAQGDYLKALINFNVPSLNNLNDKSYKLEYKSQSATDWTTATSGNVYTLNTTYLSSTNILNVDLAYSLRLTVSDYFTSAIYNVNLATGFALIDFHSSGKGLALGKVAESDNLFDVALPSYFRGGITQDIPILTTGSINDFNKAGNYYLSNTITDKPVELNGWLEVLTYSSNYAYQRFTTYTGRVFERIMSGGTWGAWCGLFNVGIWTYEKELNGLVKMWGTLELNNVNFDTKVADSWYRPSSTSSITYPEQFLELPRVYFSTSISNSSGSILAYTTGATVNGTSLWLQKMVSGTANIKLAIEVVGKWK